MTAVFNKQGNIFTVGAKEASQYFDELPAGNYLLKMSVTIGFYLEIMDSYEIKGKVYGDITKRADRILNTFLARPSTTGVLLVGEKGSGKTLLARKVTITAAEHNVPTIVINTAFCGDAFNSFIQSIHQPVVILFDEFEKVYGAEEQEQVLTLLDGVFPTKKLFMITSNDKFKLNDYMKNRPGRIYYMFEFAGLDEAFIREYCNDNVKDSLQCHINRLVQITTLFSNFNFDMLKAIVEEMNRYNEKPEEVIAVLNTKPEYNYAKEYNVELYVGGERIKDDAMSDSSWRGIPLNHFSLDLGWRDPVKDKNDANDVNDDDWKWVAVSRNEMVSFANNCFTFVSKEGHKVVLKEKEYKRFDWSAL